MFAQSQIHGRIHEGQGDSRQEKRPPCTSVYHTVSFVRISALTHTETFTPSPLLLTQTVTWPQN